MTVSIEKSECTFCGLCARECPATAILIDKDSSKASIRRNLCIQCSHCGMVCPVDAVRVDGRRLPPYPEGARGNEFYPGGSDKSHGPDKGNQGLQKELIQHLILSKRSIRSYRKEPLKEDDLDAILRAGEMSPTASNSCQVEAHILQGAEVAKAATFIAAALLKPVTIIATAPGRLLFKLLGLGRYARKDVVQRFRRSLLDTVQGNQDVLFFRAPALIILTYKKQLSRFGRTDCAIAGQNMMLSAHSRGIGSCMIGFAEAALWNKSQRKQLGVPTERRIGLIFTLGYSDQRYLRYPVRKRFSRD